MIALTLALLLSASPCGLEPAHVSGPAMITRAAFADGRLWMRTDDGVLASLAKGEAKRRVEKPPAPVLDLCVHQGHLTALTCSGSGAWRLETLVLGHWQELTRFAHVGQEGALALSCSGDRIDLLTNKRWWAVEKGKPAAVAVKTRLSPVLVATVLPRPDSMLVGINLGEWGGGLRRIDRRTGEVTVIERNESGKLCGGPLNTQCDPVNSIVESPWKPGCAIAAVGLVHMAVMGRLVEVCGTDVRAREGKGEAFFGLERVGAGVLASGVHSLYRLTADGATQIEMPKFVDVDGIWVSFELPDVVLVKTEINRRMSVSGAVPLLVPR